MKKTEFIKHVATNTGYSAKVVSEIIDMMKIVTKEALSQDEEICLTGFLSLTTKMRSERKALNLKTKEFIVVPAKKVVKVKVSKEIVDSL